MPKLMNKSASLVGQTISSFGYSGKRADELSAESEYTLAHINVDVSPSTSPFIADLTKSLVTIHGALEKSPRARQMLVRVQTFDENLSEVHGFINLKDIVPSQYNLACNGSGTALYDAALSGVEALEAEGERLYGLDFGVNAVGFDITDGENTASRVGSPAKIKAARLRAQRAEKLESLKLILVGVGTPDANDPTQPDSRTKQYLESYAKDAGYDQFIWIGAATAQNIAKLAGFVSKSIVSSSQSLGTGGASQNLEF